MSINLSQIINPESLSFSSIKNDIVAYIQSRPDYEAWKDFYEGGTGTTQVELISGLAAYLAFHSIGARRESFIDQRKLYSSAINIASTLGYPVNRVSAPRYQITFTASRSFYLDRDVPLATYKDFSLTPLYSRTILEGVNTVDCVLGEWRSFSYVANSDANFQILQVMADNIDNNRKVEYPDPDNSDRNRTLPGSLEMFINGVQHEIVTYAEELLNDAVLIKTYLDGVLLVFGDGTLGYKVRNNDEIVFNYVEATPPQDFITLDVGSLDSSYPVVFTGFVNLDPGSTEDSIEKLAVLPSGYFASKRRMLTGDDHIAMMMSYSGDMISASYNKMEDTCCTIVMCYLFEDEHEASETEEQIILNYLNDFKVVGVQLAIRPPKKYGVMFSYTVVIEEGTEIGDLQDSLEQIVSKYVNQLGQTFHAGAVTAEFSKLDGVSRVYVKYPVSDREFDYFEYLGLIYYDITFTTNKSYTVVTDPENTGYLRMVATGRSTSIEENKIICSNAKFVSGQSIGRVDEHVEVGDIAVLRDSKTDKAKVVEVVSDTELILDSNLVLENDEQFEIYRPLGVDE